MFWGQAVKVSVLCCSVNPLIASFRDIAASLGFSAGRTARSVSLSWLIVLLRHTHNAEEH